MNKLKIILFIVSLIVGIAGIVIYALNGTQYVSVPSLVGPLLSMAGFLGLLGSVFFPPTNHSDTIMQKRTTFKH